MKRIFLALAAATAALVLHSFAANAGDTVQDWDQAKAPPPPPLKDVTVKAATTSFLILDIEALTCNEKDRPRCVAAAPGIAAFAKKAREAKMLVTYSNTGRGSPETILPPLKPMEGEHVVKSSVNKFRGTDLEQYLKDKKIETVIICGTTVSGASLHTATAASLRGLKVVIPVDCNPGSSVYEEQAALFSMVNGPGTAANLTATRLSMIKID
jgi:nicotinamidase-related amidase